MSAFVSYQQSEFNNVYGHLRVVELKDLLRARGLKITGVKAELVRRLWEDDNDQRSSRKTSDLSVRDEDNDQRSSRLPKYPAYEPKKPSKYELSGYQAQPGLVVIDEVEDMSEITPETHTVVVTADEYEFGVANFIKLMTLLKDHVGLDMINML